jgi:hypothetical protein
MKIYAQDVDCDTIVTPAQPKVFTCNSRGIPNHFSRMCRQRNKNNSRVNLINQTPYPDSDEGNAWNFSINRYVNQAANWLAKLCMPLITIWPLCYIFRI